MERACYDRLVRIRSWMGFVALAALCGPWGMVGCSWLYSADALTSARPDDSGSGPNDANDASDASDATSGEAGPSEASIEDGPACAPTSVVDAAFSQSLSPFTGLSFQASSYPMVESILGSNAAVLLPVRPQNVLDAAPAEIQYAHSGLWLPHAVALASFDVTLEVLVRCTGPQSCGDGLIVAWLDATDNTILVNGNYGYLAGLPASTNGVAVDLDDFANAETTDPPAPTIQVIKLDAGQVLGKYHWTVDYRPAAFPGDWHKLEVHVRGDDVAIRYDDADLFSAKGLAIKAGYFGLTAGTGGYTDAVALRDFRGVFYPCAL
jgi:hypothetical protein